MQSRRSLCLIVLFLRRFCRLRRLGRLLLRSLWRSRRGFGAIHYRQLAALEMVDAGTRTAGIREDRGAIAIRIFPDLDRARLAGAKYDVTFAHAERDGATEQRSGVRSRRRRACGLVARRRGGRLGRRLSRARSIAVDEIVRSNRALPLFCFLEFRKGVAAVAADYIERLGKPRLLTIEIDIGAAGKRDRRCRCRQ